MEEQRQEFLERLRNDLNDITSNKWIQECKKMKPAIGDIANGYREYINDLGKGFLDFAEAYNQCLEVAKFNLVIGKNTELKARIKDFSSSYNNTEEKMLDDVFGMQVVTATEKEKEFLMLFSHLLFRIQNDKKYNKKSGYIAYHCTGDFSSNIDQEEIESIVDNIIATAKTREYKYSKNEPQYEKEKMVNLFNNLSNKESNLRDYKKMIKTLTDMLEIIKLSNLKEAETPIIEMHFLTTQVEQEILLGAASHAKYKYVKPTLIKKLFEEGRLIRGINLPWKFEANKNGLKLQNFYETLQENWPFLADDIIAKKNEGRADREIKRISKFDNLLTSQFSFFKKYIGSCRTDFPEKYKEEMWGVLKGIMIANRINMENKKPVSIEEEFIQQIDNLWPSKED